LLSNENVEGYAHGLLDAGTIHKLVPDISRRDVLLCGPPAMMNSVKAILIRQHVPSNKIHTERFSY
jgi:ferredoxin-NADP reductase